MNNRLRLLRLYTGLFAVAAGAATVAHAAASAQDRPGHLDMHVHAAGIGAGGSGAFLNEAMVESWRFPVYLRAFGVSRDEVEAAGDGLIVARISERIAQSEEIGRAVVLALDGVADRYGQLDRAATQVYVPNDFVVAEVARYDNLCFGASVNPYLVGATERLRKARAQGAVLLKWIPNIMAIDPADENLAPFYQELVRLDLPLLTHAGQERSFATAADHYGDPMRLELPLSLGVTVIAAHIATTGESDGEDNFERILPMFARYPNLFADISSLTQINKLGYLRRALAVSGLTERLVYGSDWPLQFFPLVSPYYHLRHVGLAEAWRIAGIDSAWDEDVALKRALGVPESVFARSAQLVPGCPPAPD